MIPGWMVIAHSCTAIRSAKHAIITPPLVAGLSMIDPVLLRSQPAQLAMRLRETRGFDLDVDAAASAWSPSASSCRCARRNCRTCATPARKAIGQAKAKGEDVVALMAEVAGVGDELKAWRSRGWTKSAPRLEAIALGMPNLPAGQSVPEGSDESANVEVKRVGDAARVRLRRARTTSRSASATAGSTATPRAKLSGARFTVLRGQLARLHRALAQFMLDLHTGEHGYTRRNVPLLVNADSDARHRAAAEVRGRPVQHRRSARPSAT